MGAMRYRKLGKWGLKVSEISLGAWVTFGDARAFRVGGPGLPGKPLYPGAQRL